MLLEKIPPTDKIVEKAEGDRNNRTDVKNENQVTKDSGSAAGVRAGCIAALKINRTTNPTIQNDVLRRSSS
ncbi:MAG: hypothetical protein WA832_09850, partial [Bradyrhizobium sp.]|uniref:hypothetical protein n=1 Tax=Bradyrhizobium sp. TaxID=376 RepID=UPI003C7CE940